MATTVTNKTRKPLSVPLARGKKLFLGPGKSGEIADSDAQRPAVKALIEAGSLEAFHAKGGPGALGGGGPKGGPSEGHSSGGALRRSGDR